MAARARFSIALLMAVVFVVAVDFAVVRASFRPGPSFAIAVTTMPMVNILLLALPRLSRSDARRFWLGFEAVGWSAVLLVALLGWSHRVELLEPMDRLDRLDLFGSAPDSDFPFLVAVAFVLYTTPQLLAAAIGGWLSARYRLVIERRS